MEVESAKAQHEASSKTTSHKSVPRWLRMSLRTAILMAVVALPALAVKDPAFESLTKYRSYSIAFMVLGTLVLPIWEPNLGQVVVIFTLLIPMACASIWLAYGLFAGFPNLIFVMGACVVVTFLVLFTAELLSMPLGLLSVFTTIFVACANVFIGAPRMAMTAASLLSVLLFVAAFLATLVCWLVFPEFCVDEVIRYHHEGLEHLLHLAHYAFHSTPPALRKRVADSTASTFGEGSKWLKVFSAADEQVEDAGVYPALLQRGQSGLAAAAAAGAGGVQEEVARAHAVERSWQRVHMALQAANKAQVGAKAEVVLAAVAHKRIIVPCIPLIPCAKGQMDDAALKALQHVATATSLHIYKLFSALNPLDEGTEQLMYSLMSSEQWNGMRAALFSSLQELVDAFPMDYYPAGAPDAQYVMAFQAAVERLAAAWSSDQLAHKAAGAGSSSGASPDGKNIDQHAVTITPEAAAAAAEAAEAAESSHSEAAVALGDVFTDPLVPAGSAAAGVLARLHMAMLVRMLKELAEQLQQLYDMAAAVSDSMLRFKCC